MGNLERKRLPAVFTSIEKEHLLRVCLEKKREAFCMETVGASQQHYGLTRRSGAVEGKGRWSDWKGAKGREGVCAVGGGLVCLASLALSNLEVKGKIRKGGRHPTAGDGMLLQLQGKKKVYKNGGPPFKTRGPSQRATQRQEEERLGSLKYS